MYRCTLCQDVVPAGTQAHQKVLETRPVTYPFREQAQRPKKRTQRSKSKHWRRDRGGEGFEIVREVLVCPTCAAADG